LNRLVPAGAKGRIPLSDLSSQLAGFLQDLPALNCIVPPALQLPEVGHEPLFISISLQELVYPR